MDAPLDAENENEDAGSAEDAAAGETVETEPEFAEHSYTLTFGAALEDGVVLKSSEADYYVLVRDTVFNAFKDLSRADLVKAPEPEGEMTAASGG